MARARTAKGSGNASGMQAGRSTSPSVLAFRNRRMSTFRGNSVDAYGDETNVGTPHLTGIPAALAETTQTVFDAATQRPQTVREITCIVDNWADIDADDTLQDEFTGYFYMVESIQARPGIGYYPPQKILTLRMRSGVTIASD
jgi:hypothetical protein